MAIKSPPSLQGFTYEERLNRLRFTTLEQRRESEDLIVIYRIMEDVEKLDSGDLVLQDTRGTRGHGKKLKKDHCRRGIKNSSLPHRGKQTLNKLEQETVKTNKIHAFKIKLDKSRYGDTTAQA